MLRLRHPLALLLISIFVLLGVLRSFSTPAPVGADAPEVVFSAMRAEAILRDLLQEKVPHVSGSAANAVVRDRVLAHLQAAAYDTEVQSLFHCNLSFGRCSTVENIIAIKPGSEGRQAVLLTAHYDSGWAGPGAADDGASTAAILEIARMAADFPPFRNDIIFLITDSEENGLIGADAFVRNHPLFDRVGAVINLEARGVTGPSVMFETGEGNRSIIRMLAKNVDRPVANSLTYEVYKRMPNDTDYSVYRNAGVMGVNFAFSGGVALYHSVLDDPDHLDLGSLQHQGDNAWGMLTGLGERDLNTVSSREDAGYIDIFGLKLTHYPVSIAGGLMLVLGVWTMFAITLAFRRDFRFRQLRWGVVAIPLLMLAIVGGGYLLSWPLGHWADLHPIEHPFPWVGRLTLFAMLGLVCYAALKLFSNRVSPCAWMILAWGLIFMLGMVLTSKLPAAAHIALLPLAMFSLGSIIDLFRKKSPAPLLVATLLGFTAAVFISLYHFLMLDTVLNFDMSHLKVVTFWIMSLAVMPMLLAFVKKRDLTWQPARWLLLAVLAGCVLHLFLPSYTSERPRDMNLMYREIAGQDVGYVVLESIYRRHDRSFAKKHDFEMKEVNSGRLGTEERPVREVPAQRLPGFEFTQNIVPDDDESWRRRMVIDLPDDVRMLRLMLPEEAAVQKAWVNGVLALDTGIETKHDRKNYTIGLVYPGSEPITVELLSRSGDRVRMSALTWHKLPGVLTAPFMGNWPDDAQPFLFGPRAERIAEIDLEPAGSGF